MASDVQFPKNKVVYALLAIFLGVWGAHKYYVGDIKNGIFYLLLFACTLGLGSVLTLITAIIALVLSDEDFNQRYVVDKKFI